MLLVYYYYQYILSQYFHYFSISSLNVKKTQTKERTNVAEANNDCLEGKKKIIIQLARKLLSVV